LQQSYTARCAGYRQFAIAIVLVAGIIVIVKQLNFINKSDLGYKIRPGDKHTDGYADASKIFDVIETGLKKNKPCKDVRQQAAVWYRMQTCME